MRPYWKGYLKLALVSCPIALHAACSTSERVAFRQINKATGNRLRQQLIDEDTRQPVDPEHKGRGYEVARGQYIIVEDFSAAKTMITIAWSSPVPATVKGIIHVPAHNTPIKPSRRDALLIAIAKA